jgi:hypothetical protein
MKTTAGGVVVLLALAASACSNSLNVGFFEPPASLTISPASYLAFSAEVDAQSTAVSFTIANVGGMPADAVQGSLGGADARDWMIQHTTCDGPLDGSASCTVDVVFAPLTAGATKTASLTAYGIGSEPASAALEGVVARGAMLAISMMTAALTPSGPPPTFTVSNMGDLPTKSLTVTLSAGFSFTTDCSNRVLNPGDKCAVTISDPVRPSDGGPACPPTGSLTVGDGTLTVSATLTCSG